MVRFESLEDRSGDFGLRWKRRRFPTRQLLPAQIKAFAASHGTRAKTNRIDAELIARFMAFRPRSDGASRMKSCVFSRPGRPSVVSSLIRENAFWLRSTDEKLGVADTFSDMNVDLKARLDCQIAELERRIEGLIAHDSAIAETAAILCSIPDIRPAASTILIAEVPELGQVNREQATALTGLAPIAHDSGILRGTRAIGGGRRALRHVMFQAALVAAHHNPTLKTFADRLREAGKPQKVIIAVTRKLVTVANALCKSRCTWTTQFT